MTHHLDDAVVIRELCEDDGPRLLEAVAASRELHEPWVSPPRDLEGFFALLARSRRDDHVSYLAWRSNDLVGVVNLNNIVRGQLMSAYLGYYGFAPHVGRGRMRRALSLAIDEAFTTHGLHRLEANVQPANHRSRRLVEGLGFRREGLSPNYLRVGGQWRDHERWALLVDEWPGADAQGRRQSTGSAP